VLLFSNSCDTGNSSDPTNNLRKHKTISRNIQNIKNDTAFYFSYSQLSKGIIKGNEIDLHNSTVNYYKIKKNKKVGSVTVERLKDNKFNIEFYKYLHNDLNGPFYFRDKVVVWKKHFTIDSLLFGANLNDATEPFSRVVNSAYDFKYKTKDFIVFFLQNTFYNDSNPGTVMLLLDITNKDDIFPFIFGPQMNEDLSSFGDFNNDNLLDIAYLKNEFLYSDTLRCYSYIGSKFKEDRYHFLIIKDNNDGRYKIDLKNSNWWNIE